MSESSSTLAKVSRLGLACGVCAAVLYTAANICLRQVVHVDPVWVSAIKAIPTFLMVAPLVFLRYWRGQVLWSTRSDILWLIVTGFCAQIFGNVAFQWSLSILGLAISVPMILGAMLVGGALIGRVVLGEPVRPRTLLAVVLLIVAAVILTRGAQSSVSNQPDVQVWQIVLAVCGNMAAGIAYAFLGTMMRRSMQAGMPMISTLFVLSVVGTGLLGTWALFTVGVPGMLATAGVDFAIMFAGGAFNALAFLLLAKALQQLPVLYVQLLNATQAGMAAIAGWLIFGEQLSPMVQLGLALTAAGLIIAGTRSTRPKLMRPAAKRLKP
ncbi:DMT family transporter [Aureliella helgolandensis]|uniref:EamA-like transporter family protein n=1 Tax=Aureliella helgolandensis TaxID=2527968 RepID=A0A518G2F0_9BACT|nr:DMT family transporter [Aureliella helgolandensis]QDV22719.1 EamA-like transporter family protein [Aureliella helgolandensis]